MDCWRLRDAKCPSHHRGLRLRNPKNRPHSCPANPRCGSLERLSVGRTVSTTGTVSSRSSSLLPEQAASDRPADGSGTRSRLVVGPWLRRPRAFVLLVLASSMAALVLLGQRMPFADGDTLSDLGESLASIPGHISRLWWPPVTLVVAAAAVHYLLAAVTLRAAAGRRSEVPVGEAVAVSLVAAVANRLSPAGLGGAGVNTRFLSKRGMDLAEASGAIAALSLLGAVADLLALSL